MTTTATSEAARPTGPDRRDDPDARALPPAPTAPRPARLTGALLLALAGAWIAAVSALDVVLRNRGASAPVLAVGPVALALSAAVYLETLRYRRARREIAAVRHIADVTQKALLHPVPDRIGPLDAAVRYLSAHAGAGVGGDFYEVIETSFGIRALIGDVRGCGLPAVSGAAAVLGAFREAGAVEPDLASVAARLDAALVRHSAARPAPEPGDAEGHAYAEDFATALLVEVPVGGLPADVGEFTPADAPSITRAQYLSCGHHAPFLLRGGETRLLEPRRRLAPLGLCALVEGAEDPGAGEPLDLLPGDRLVLYTDGFLDARDHRGAFFPLADVLGASRATTASPSALAEHARRRLLAHTRGRRGDDAALLVLGFAPQVRVSS